LSEFRGLISPVLQTADKISSFYLLFLTPLGGTYMFCISANKHISESVILVIICFMLKLLVSLLPDENNGYCT